MDSAEAKADLATVCHWYEEAPNVNSSTRIFAALMVAGLFICLGLLITYMVVTLVQKKGIDSTVIHELAWMSGTFATALSVAMGVRNVGVK